MLNQFLTTNSNSKNIDVGRFNWLLKGKINFSAILLLLIAGFTLFRFFVPFSRAEENTSSETKSFAIPVKTITVSPQSHYQITRSYTGTVLANRTTKLGFEQGGKVIEFLVGEGEAVSRDQPLARLDAQRLQTQKRQLQAQHEHALAKLNQFQNGPRQETIEAARANVRNLEQQLRLTGKQRSRRDFLYQQGAISKEKRDQFSTEQQSLQAQLDEARSQLEELLNGTRSEKIAAQQATVQELEARIDEIEVLLEQTVIKAPFDGVISNRLLDEGAVVQTGEPILQLIENVAPEAHIGVPVKVANQLQMGQLQKLSVGRTQYSGTVSARLPDVDSETRTQTIIFDLNQVPGREVAFGQSVTLTYQQEIDHQGYWLPTSALSKGARSLWTCYVAVPVSQGQGWQVQQETVKIIHQQGNRVFVGGTLQPNSQVVATGTHRLVPGQRVSIQSSGKN